MSERMGKSIKHQDKLRKLAEPGTDIETIGPVQVCFDQEFCIGTGNGGTSVYVGLHEDGSEVAVKRVLINKDEQLHTNINEKEILLHVKASKHIVNYRHFEYKKPFFFLILDLCEETLENYVEAHDEEHLKHHGPVIIREILTGLSALHAQKKKILHLDLKPQNILVDSEGHMCLTDFGISRILNEEQTTLEIGQMGTRGWIAAESMAIQDSTVARFKRKSDIQVAGMISFYVLTKGKHPFGDIHHCVLNIIEGNPVNLEQLSDSLARNFVASMISHKIEDRPYAEEALKHPFLQIKPGDTRNPELHISEKFANVNVVDSGNQVEDPALLQEDKRLFGYETSSPSQALRSSLQLRSFGLFFPTLGFEHSHGDRILMEVLEEVYLMVQDPKKIDVQRTLATGHIELKLEINETKFEVQFPKTFPDIPAKIVFTSPKQPNQRDLKPSEKNEKFDTSNRILTSLRSCSGHFNSQRCSTNQPTATTCVQPAGTSTSKKVEVASKKQIDPEVVALMTFSEKVCVKLKDTFEIADVVNMQLKEDRPGKRAELTFEHHHKKYLFAVPVEFPEKPARIYYTIYSIRKMTEVVPKSRRPLNNISEILNAVKYECTCAKCFRTRN